MDIDKIFGLFDQSSDTPLTNSETETLFDLKNTPVFWLGMFKKIITSSNSLYFQLNTILPQNVDVQGITSSMIYTRSWEFISKVDISKSTQRICK